MKSLTKYKPKIKSKINRFIFTKNYEVSYFKGGFESFGNNIQQIALAITYCNLYGYNFYLENHPYINDFKVVNNNFFENFSKIRRSYRFFYFDKPITNFYQRKDYFNKDENDFPIFEGQLSYYVENLHETVQKFIKPNLKIYKKINLGEDTLVIHIRSGDIFELNWHSMYVQNPLSYFKMLIEMYKKTIVVTSDFKNPVIEILSKLKNVTIVSGNFIDDINILLNAKNLASSGVGTFVVAAALLSNSISRFYCSQYYLNEHLNPEMLKNNIEINKFYIENYIEIGDFLKNSENINKIISDEIKVRKI